MSKENKILIFPEVDFSNLANFNEEEKKKIQSSVKIEVANVHCPKCQSLNIELRTYLTMFYDVPMECKDCREIFHLFLNIRES